ncbi:MAG: SDR family oxidoreductase [Defluviitaleaceae bacterium]|nr:SDR family oxidoreductase [Defluviitaleaceae bacterium]
MRIFITGGTKGIGQAAALHFAKCGHHVAICGNSDKIAWEQTSSNLRLINKNSLSFLGNVANYDDAAAMIDAAINAFGGIDVLINNAAISHVGFFADMKPHQWQRLIDVNLNGVINCSHVAVRQMLSQEAGGAIINISSIWGNVGASCEAVYSATKGGINTFTKALAKELGGANIRINAIAAGVVQTGMNDFLSEAEAEELMSQIPLRRFATPQEIVEALDFIVSSKYITGQIITIDGGLT